MSADDGSSSSIGPTNRTKPADFNFQYVIVRAKCGDEPAFEKLFHRYNNGLYTAALRLGNNAADAKDIAQEAWLNAFRALAQCKAVHGEGSFRSWLSTIALHCHLRRRLGLERIVLVPWDGTEIVAGVVSEEIDSFSLELGGYSVAGLTDKEKYLLHQHYVLDLPMASIAAELQENVKTLTSQLRRAVEKIRKAME